MIEVKSRLRKWGNSLGVVVPQKVIENENAREGDEVILFLKTDSENLLRKMFGSFKFKKSTDELMKEIDEELYDV